MRASVDNEESFHFQHGEGRLQLMDAWRPPTAGELPDYMLEFVNSLMTRAEQPTC